MRVQLDERTKGSTPVPLVTLMTDILESKTAQTEYADVPDIRRFCVLGSCSFVNMKFVGHENLQHPAFSSGPPGGNPNLPKTSRLKGFRLVGLG